MKKQTAKWHFTPLDPGRRVRETVVDEFFAGEKTGKPGVALVREGIQNALDARAGDTPVIVRIFLSGEKLPCADVAYLSAGLWEHFNASKKSFPGGRPPPQDEPWRYVVFEDFGTRGLEGDAGSAFGDEKGGNHFYHFFRAEGQSDKDAGSRGSWGIGKQVFWASSRIHTVFGLTMRKSDRRIMLMGSTLLKMHGIGGKHYQEGYYGIKGPDSRIVLPCEEEAPLEKFRRLFGLKRVRVPGLSLVVPQPHEEINRESLILAVLEDYFYPILCGQLQVYINVPGVETRLDSDNFERVLAEMELNENDEKAIGNKAKLARRSLALKDRERIVLRKPAANKKWHWSRELLPQDRIPSLRERYRDNRHVAFRVPVTVRPKDARPRDSCFDVFVMRDKTEKFSRPAFVREGLVIPEVGQSRVRGAVALVVAERGPLADFLRDAENPAHTDWQAASSNFKGKYKSGSGDLQFVKESVRKIVAYLMQDDSRADRTLLENFFPRMYSGGGKTGAPPGGLEAPASNPAAFEVREIAGGFGISGTASGILCVRAAYDTAPGNPLRKYHVSDFSFAPDAGENRIRVQAEGAEIVSLANNRIRVKAAGEFSIRAAGFDENRDVYVRVTKDEDETENPGDGSPN